MTITTTLDVSTGHLRTSDRKLLEGYLHNGEKFPGQTLIVRPYPYGWMVITSGWDLTRDADDGFEVRAQAARDEGFSEEFINLMRRAVEQKTVQLQFDRDGDPEPGFPIFDWENGDTMSMPEDDETPRPAI